MNNHLERHIKAMNKAIEAIAPIREEMIRSIKCEHPKAIILGNDTCELSADKCVTDYRNALIEKAMIVFKATYDAEMGGVADITNPEQTDAYD
jgi:hypothetical protein